MRGAALLGRFVLGRPAPNPLIAASIYDRYSVSPSIGPSFTRCWFTITNMIQKCSNFQPSTPNAGGVSRGLLNTPAQSKLLHTWIKLIIVRQHLVQIGRIDGSTEYVS